MAATGFFLSFFLSQLGREDWFLTIKTGCSALVLWLFFLSQSSSDLICFFACLLACFAGGPLMEEV